MLKGPRALCKKKRMFPMLLTLPPPSHTLSPFTLSLLLPLPSSSLFAFHSIVLPERADARWSGTRRPVRATRA